jgi:hypothetical protein
MIGRYLLRTVKVPSLPYMGGRPALVTVTSFSTRATNEHREESIRDLANSIDTTLTEEQKVYVAKIKKDIRGPGKVRCKKLKKRDVLA